LTERTGIIGLGLVGAAIAERLLEAGYRLTGYDVREERRDAFQKMGGEPVCCAAGVALECDCIVLSLPTSAIAGAVIDEMRPNLRSGALIVDTTTGAPDDALRFSTSLAGAGVAYLDATIAGSSRQVRNGEAIFICGGTEQAFARSSYLLSRCCNDAFHVGPAGSGARMKLAVNLVLGLNRAVLAEGLEYARACGIDPYLALEILKASPAYSRAMDTKGPRMLNNQFEPEARLSQHLKDVRLILESGRQAEARLPLSAVHRELLETVEAAGFGGLDNSAIIKAFQNPTRS